MVIKWLKLTLKWLLWLVLYLIFACNPILIGNINLKSFCHLIAVYIFGIKTDSMECCFCYKSTKIC